METERRIKLEIGEEKMIELYPRSIFVKGKYLGCEEDYLVFENGNSEGREYIFMDNHWTIESKGKLTYIGVSSMSVNILSKEDLNERNSKTSSKFMDILTKLNVKE